MKKCTLLFVAILCSYFSYSQSDYLDFTGLSNTNSLVSRVVGNTAVTFDASISNTGNPNTPNVSANGDFSIQLEANTEQCLNLSFSTPVSLNIVDNTNSSHGILEEADFITFSDLNYTLTDPDNKINIVNSSQTPSVAEFTTGENISNYSTWDISYPTIS